MLMIVTDKLAADVVRDARITLAIHHQGELNLCDGCYELTCGFSWFPCEKARWALSVLAEVGVDSR